MYIIYEGPKGGPGMSGRIQFTLSRLGKDVALKHHYRFPRR